MHYPSDEPWKYLIRQIHQGKCVPFLGAGISAPTLPLAKDLANNLAKEFDYPLKEDSDNLSKVSQFIEIQYDKSSTKERVCEIIAKVPPPDFTQYKDTPHAILSKLDFPLYITTNYDKFIEEALKSNGKKPISDFCRWTEDLEEFGEYNEINSDLYKENNRFKITSANPLVYHLHGIIDYPNSILLTESDYIDFLTTLVHKEKNILPYPVRRKFTENPFLFIGYSLQDVNLQLIRNILGNTSGYAVFPHLSFNTDFSSNDFEVNKRLEYIARNFHNRFKIYTLWGTAEEFAMELRNQLEKYIQSSTN